MSDPLGLSIGTTNLVAARVGNQPVIRRSVLTLADGTLLTGFVERIGDSVPLVAPDGSTHHADRLLVDALGAILQASGGQPVPEITIAVPAYWGMTTLRTLRTALRASPDLAANGTPARLVSDAVASLTALHANLGLPSQGVVALLDFGGGGTSITLTDAGAAFEAIDESTRFTEFAGDQIDQALLGHIVDGIAATGGIDPSGTAAVGSLARLREECRRAKERLSVDTETEVTAELPGYRAAIRVARTELESLIAAPLDGVLAALGNTLKRNGISWSNVSAVVTVGGGAGIPLIAQRLSEHSSAPVVRTPQPAFDAALGAALFSAYGLAAEAQTSMAPAADAQTGMAPAAEAQTGLAPVPFDARGSETVSALAWSQDDDISNEPVPYTGENPYVAEAISMRQPVQYVPPTGPIEEPRTWQRLPQVLIGLAAAVALIAVGGVAIALTSVSNSTSATTEPPSTAQSVRQSSPESPPPAPPAETVTVTGEVPPPAPPPHHHRRAGHDDARDHDDAADHHDHHDDHHHHHHDHYYDDHHDDDDRRQRRRRPPRRPQRRPRPR